MFLNFFFQPFRFIAIEIIPSFEITRFMGLAKLIKHYAHKAYKASITQFTICVLF